MAKFVFVNRIGFRNDSTGPGPNDSRLQGVCVDMKYYDKKANTSWLIGACYNRNLPKDNQPLSDSIVFWKFEASPGCEYIFEIELVWKKVGGITTTKNLKYNLKDYPETDTLKFARDTTIKFIWPDDTASGRFVNTLYWPQK